MFPRIVFALLPVGFLALAGCRPHAAERLEWTTMGTVAALQVRGNAAALSDALERSQNVCRLVMREFNAHDPSARLHALARLPETEALAAAEPSVRPCYAAAFALSRASDRAFNPRWRGEKTLDLGAIAKGFAVDAIARDVPLPADAGDVLIDLGGNLKSVRGTWLTGVADPFASGVAATVSLQPGEALATSAEYFRGKHICDGRTNRPVSNDVASVTVLCRSALWADGLSTTLFVLGPEDGRRFLDAHLGELPGAEAVSVLWILAEGRRVIYGDDRFR